MFTLTSNNFSKVSKCTGYSYIAPGSGFMEPRFFWIWIQEAQMLRILRIRILIIACNPWSYLLISAINIRAMIVMNIKSGFLISPIIPRSDPKTKNWSITSRLTFRIIYFSFLILKCKESKLCLNCSFNRYHCFFFKEYVIVYLGSKY